MHRRLLILRYDGTHYCGWQVQKNAVSVQQTVQDAIERVTGVRAGLTGLLPYRRRGARGYVLLCIRYRKPTAAGQAGAGAQRLAAGGYRGLWLPRGAGGFSPALYRDGQAVRLPHLERGGTQSLLGGACAAPARADG